MRQPRTLAALGSIAAAVIVAPPAAATLTATTGPEGRADNRIVIADDDGSSRRILTAGESSQVSPDGTKVAVIDYVYNDDYELVSTTLKVLDAAGGPPTFTLSVGSISVDWTPDSAKLMVTDYTGGARQRLLTIDPATGEQIEHAAGIFGGWSMSPDMKAIAYVELAAGNDTVAGGGTLKVRDLASGMTATIARRATAPLWGPRAIAYELHTRRRGRWVYDVARIRPDGTGYKRLTRIRPTRIFLGLRPIAWSADGRRILPDVAALEGYWLNTYTVNAIRGGARLLHRGVMATALSRDGRYIIGQTGDPSTTGFTLGKIVRVSWKTGKRRLLLRRALAASYSG